MKRYKFMNFGIITFGIIRNFETSMKYCWMMNTTFLHKGCLTPVLRPELRNRFEGNMQIAKYAIANPQCSPLTLQSKQDDFDRPMSSYPHLESVYGI